MKCVDISHIKNGEKFKLIFKTENKISKAILSIDSMQNSGNNLLINFDIIKKIGENKND